MNLEELRKNLHVRSECRARSLRSCIQLMHWQEAITLVCEIIIGIRSWERTGFEEVLTEVVFPDFYTIGKK